MTPLSQPAVIIETLSRTPELILPLVRETPPERLRLRPAPEKWSIHEHACHLAEVHPLFFERLDLMLTHDDPEIAPYFPDQDAEAGSLLDRDLDASLERFRDDRARLVERIRALAPAAWERTARHGEYERYSVLIMFRHLALHDLFHAYRIEDLALSRHHAPR